MMRIGYGEDIHCLEDGGEFYLCGVLLPYPVHPIAHSDGDVALHAIADALLGALGLRDIGYYYPDTSAKTKGIRSEIIIKEIMDKVRDAHYMIANLDVLVVLEHYKLSPYIDSCKENLAKLLHIEGSQIAIKAMTNEGLDEVGKGKAIRAVANVLLEEKKNAE